MKFRSPTYLPTGIAFCLALLLTACANIVKPGGGPRDEQGPRILYTEPAMETTNFRGNTVDLYFDEFLKPGSYVKEVFVSPVQDQDPVVTVRNKRLRIQFQDELRENTTYVITLSTEIKDFNEGNPMQESFTCAFSTGPVLDSLRITGTVVNAWKGQPQAEMKVLLFPARDLEGDSIWGRRPVYATTTNEEGHFELNYLAEGEYKIYAVNDLDQSFSYNSEKELLGLTVDPLIDLRDTNQRKKPVEMWAFLQDQTAPKVRFAKWINDFTVHLALTEPIVQHYGMDTFAVSISDTLGENAKNLTAIRFKDQDSSHLYLHIPEGRGTHRQLNFSHLIDTLGNQSDSTLRLDPNIFDKTEQGLLYGTPLLLAEKNQIQIATYFNLSTEIDASKVELTDTSGNRIPVKVTSRAMKLTIEWDKWPNPGEVHLLRLDSSIVWPDGSALDTSFEFSIVFPDLDDFGSMKGKVVPDSTVPDANWTMLVMGSSSQANAVSVGGRNRKGGGGSPGGNITVLKRIPNADSYHLSRMKPGKYTIRFIKDDDGNGVFTPGSLSPYRLPERVLEDPKPMEVRAKWEVEGYNVFPSW